MQQAPPPGRVVKLDQGQEPRNGASALPLDGDVYKMGASPGIGEVAKERPGGIRVGSFNMRTFSSLENPVFRLYFGAMAGWMAAMNSRMVARSLLVYLVSGSATVLGLMALANSVPMFFFSLYGGVLADRVQKKDVLLVGVIFSGISSVALGLCITLGFLGPQHPESWWILIVAAVVEGIIMGLMLPSRQSMIAEIVPQEQLMNAVALNNFEMNINRMLIPALGGFFIAGFGFANVFYVMGAMYVVSAVFLLMMPRTSTIAARTGNSTLSDMKDGFIYAKNQPTILLVLVITFFIVLLSTPYMSLLPVFTEDILHVGSEGMGILISVSGIGAIVGSIVLASLPNKWRGAMLIGGGAVLGLSLTAFSFSNIWWFSLMMILFVGLGQTMRMTLGSTLLQYYVEDKYRGRVMSLYMMEFGLTSLGTFIAALLADFIGVQWSVGGLAIMLVVASILMFVFLPHIRRLD